MRSAGVGVVAAIVLAAGWADAAILSGGVPDPNYQVGGQTVMQLWIKADGINTNAGSGQVRIDSGTVYVTNWLDGSTFDNDAVQSVTTRQPVYTANAVNGQPAVYFDGTTNFVTADGAAVGLASNYTVFVVANELAPRATDYKRIFTLSTSSAEDPNAVHGLVQADAHRVIMNVRDSGGTFAGYFTHTTGTNLWVNALFGWKKEGDRLTLGADGAYTVGQSYSSGNVGATPFDWFTLGTYRSFTYPNGGDDRFFNGYVAELIAYKGSLSHEDIDHVGYYLQTKYGLSGTYTPPSSWATNRILKGRQPNPNFMVETNRAMVLWLDAGVIDTNDATQVKNSCMVKWPGRSRQAGSAAQAQNSGYRPAYQASGGPAGLPAVDFDGVDNWLAADAVGDQFDEEYTVFVVAYEETQDNRGFLMAAKSDGSGPQRFHRVQTLGTYVQDDAAVGHWQESSYAVPANTWMNLLVGWDRTVTTDELAFGTNGASYAVAIGKDLGATTLGWLTIGAARAYSGGPTYYNWFDGRIAELIAYNKMLSSEQINEIGYYLQNKYGLAGSYTIPWANGSMFVIR